MNQNWMDKEALKRLHPRELAAWEEFLKWNRHTVIKILTIHQRYLARQPAPFLNVMIQAMWMSMVVFAGMMAFGPMVGPFPSMVIGCVLAAMVNRAMHGLGALLHDKLEDMLTKQKEEKDGDSSSSG